MREEGTMKIAPEKPNTFPIPVLNPDLWVIGSIVVQRGYQWRIVGKEAGLVLAQPIGKRRERRAAVRAVFK